jgi:hypothetical protein
MYKIWNWKFLTAIFLLQDVHAETLVGGHLKNFVKISLQRRNFRHLISPSLPFHLRYFPLDRCGEIATEKNRILRHCLALFSSIPQAS